jgi:MFS family permease
MSDDGPKFLPSQPPTDDRITAPPGVQTAGSAASGPRLAVPPLAAVVPGARAALVLLLFINMFNYIDRQVLAALVKPIEAEFFPNGGPLVKTWMGLLGTAFMAAFMLLAPVFGWLADRMSRWKLMSIGVAVWSLASGASGLATGYAAMFVTRCVVGVGEAAYGPAAPAVLSDLYPESRRGTIFAYFYSAIPVGSALGFMLGGLVLWLTRDWRWAFYAVVPPGLLLAAFCLFMREPKRGESDPHAKPHARSWGDYLVFLKTPSFVLATLGYTAATFAIGGIGYWIPAYCEDRGQNNLEVTQIFGGIVVVSGFIATLAGGWLGDALRRRLPGSYFLVSGLGMLIAFPLMLAFLFVPFPWAYLLIFAAVFFLFFNTGPVNTIVANVTHPARRASAFALVILVIHLFGDTLSPTVMGFVADEAKAVGAAAEQPSWWSDFLQRNGGMDVSFFVASLTILAAAALWLWGMRYLERDTARAATRGTEGGG